MKVRRFFESVYHDNDLRQVRKRDLSGDLARYAGNTALRPVEELLISRYRRPDTPVVFIVGVPRSGTTLLYQLMVRQLQMGYVNNYMARFWMAPIVGAIAYRLAHRREDASIPLKSHLGGTPTPASPHEFSWFWEYWTEFGDIDDHPESSLQKMQWEPIRRELEGLAGFFEAPLVLKSINYVNYHIEWIARLMPQAKFLWIRRKSEYVAQSIYESRQKRYDDPEVWWSVRPADVDRWLDRPPAEQIAHQIRDIDRGVREGLRAIDPARHRTLTYESLTLQPRETLRAVADLADARMRDDDAIGQLGLAPRNEQRLPDETFDSLARALEEEA
jgi:hypothetical protein